MALRAILLVALALSLFPLVARSEDRLTFIGSTVKTEDAVLKSDDVFIGQIIKIGAVIVSAPDVSYYAGIEVAISKVLKGTLDGQIDVTSNRHYPEQALKKGDSYVFFEAKDNYGQFHAFKLIPASELNIHAVELAIASHGT